MKVNRRKILGLAGAVFLPGVVQAALPALAKIIVPYAAGGPFDFVGRQLAEQLRGTLATSVVVDNRAGAAGRLAIDLLKQAPPDGTMLMINAGGIQSLFPYVFKNLNYDPFRDVAPVSLTHKIEFGFAVGEAVPATVKTLKDYVAWVKGDLKRGSFATPGAGTPLHFLPVLVGKEAGVDLTPVHYRGAATIWPDFFGGVIPAASLPLTTLLQQVATGKVRIIATSGAVRHKFSPDAPTFAEQGFPQLTSSDWLAVYVSGRTPPDVQEQLSAMVRQALAQPALVESFAKAYMEPFPSTPAQAVQLARSDSLHWSKAIKLIGYTPE
ncbi:MAG: tripartite tricarboxylate transporter substrate-binding protein [Burkholderiaceae bacterium]|nr:tripartite tricarboxylate transporter substrate-binding protein [Burkholderiaceae bacterium]